MGVIEINRKPSRRDLKWFGFILPVFFGIVGSVAFFRFDAARVATVVWSAGAALAVLYATIPPFRIPMYLGWMHLFFPLGWTISNLVLVVLYFLVVTPIGLILRLFRYDPLARRRDPEATTYWTEHRTGKEPSRYLRQF